jgi:hypothetical protein
LDQTRLDPCEDRLSAVTKPYMVSHLGGLLSGGRRIQGQGADRGWARRKRKLAGLTKAEELVPISRVLGHLADADWPAEAR